ncbi:MAG: cation diffusion facilitator family transporter [Rhodospirillales bacterium]|nr:cation diffusion facilitator family transporter [Rhodospirillales bacterium]MDP6645480.1 cation diffusion facilitator family transporter [Rhodospirillales bacterium]MDP6843192.1 cation diffusion facilitator family transporter [Rhodospirillales bacterium]
MQDSPLQVDSRKDTSAKLMVAATYASVSVAAVLICAKMGAWLFTDSVSLLSSLVDSLLDAAASLVNLFAVRQALQPADKEHRFGHGKAESLAGLWQAAFIAGSGVFLMLESVERIISPSAIENGPIGIAVMGFSIVLTVVLVGFQMYVVKRTGSVAISADSLHYRIDILINFAVIVSLLLASFGGWILADPLFAILIVTYMGIGAYKILRQSLNDLMDTEFPEEDRARIRDIVLEHPKVHEIHDMRTRSSGPYSFIQLHIEMDHDITLLEAHNISDQVMYKVEAAFPNTEVLIHQDPEGIEERRDHL